MGKLKKVVSTVGNVATGTVEKTVQKDGNNLLLLILIVIVWLYLFFSNSTTETIKDKEHTSSSDRIHGGSGGKF